MGLVPHRFRLVWTHEQIMGVITNGGQNVHPDLAYFDAIVPCGLAGRGVTSLHLETTARGAPRPTLEQVLPVAVAAFAARFGADVVGATGEPE